MLNSRDLSLLHWKVQEKYHELEKVCWEKHKIKFINVGTVRDEEYQQLLFSYGRTDKSKSIVTKQAKPSFHWDKVGLAVDVCPVDSKGNCKWNDTQSFLTIAKEAVLLGFTAGANWKSFPDLPHLQLDGGLTASQIWAGKRPSWFYDKKPVDKPIPKVNPIEILYQKSIVGSLTYWSNINSTGYADGSFVSTLIRNYCRYITGKAYSLEDAVDFIRAKGLISSVDYWVENAVSNGRCRADYTNVLIERLAGTIK